MSDVSLGDENLPNPYQVDTVAYRLRNGDPSAEKRAERDAHRKLRASELRARIAAYAFEIGELFHDEVAHAVRVHIIETSDLDHSTRDVVIDVIATYLAYAEEKIKREEQG